MSPAIQCRQLFKTYAGKPPVEAVRGIDLQVQRGECFGVLGPNGAGKTTTIEILEGLLEPTGGDVEVLGLKWKQDCDEIRQQIGISLQETQLSEKLTVLETLTLFRSFYRQGLDPRRAIERVSLDEKANAWVKKLSGGQKQRLAVATALVGNPQLLFLDEPTTGLDPQSRREVWGIVGEFRHQGRTVLLTTHYMEEAERLCDRVAIIDRGQVIATGTPRELIAGLGGEHVVEFSIDGAASDDTSATKEWANLPAVTDCRSEAGRNRLSVTEPHVAIPALIQRLTSENRRLVSLHTRHASLEDVFVRVAGRTLQQAEEEGAA